MHRSCAELIRYRKDLARPAPFECVCALIWQARCQKTHSMARDLRLSDTWRGGEKAFGRILRLLRSAPHRVTVEVPLSRLGSMRTHHGGRSLQGVLQATGKEQVFLVAHGGGLVVLMYIARNPEARERVRALVTLRSEATEQRQRCEGK